MINDSISKSKNIDPLGKTESDYNSAFEYF